MHTDQTDMPIPDSFFYLCQIHREQINSSVNFSSGYLNFVAIIIDPLTS